MVPRPSRAGSLAGLLAGLLACALGAAPSPRPPSAAPVPPVPPPARLLLGPERILCGVTAPTPGKKTKINGQVRPLGLILWFHGGMRSRNPEKGLEAHRPLLDFVDPSTHVLASPSAFAGRDWLGPGALATTEALIDTLLALHPIDTAAIRLLGVSDGCLAVIRYGGEGRRRARSMILVSSLPQLALAPTDLSRRSRLAEGRWDFLQGGRDRLFPAEAVVPFLREWERVLPNARLHLFPEGEHDFPWYATHAAPLLRELLGGGGAPATPSGRKPQKPQNSEPVQKSLK